ncbi:MAG: His/Gly/Thr/Pro-type tRNA ligase C-terminal domain-containing protein, partial [Dehalococcoidia bacterium]
SADYLCQECGQHFGSLQGYLTALGIKFVLNHRLVRGLDYYTKTVFEIQPADGGSQSALGGGGRYDDLIAMIGGKPVPGIGFAAGLERIVLNLKTQGVNVPPAERPAIFIACIGVDARIEAYRLSAALRAEGIPLVMSSGERSLKAQLRHANAAGVKYAAIIGGDEMEAGTVMLRNMQTGEQQEKQPEELVAMLKAGE